LKERGEEKKESFQELLSRLRREYSGKFLREEDLPPEPFSLFYLWFEEAVKKGEKDPNAFALATATREGIPSVRFVLMKDLKGERIEFYTSLVSKKARDLKENPVASGVFFWPVLMRQVVFSGKVEKIRRVDVERYFSTRPRPAQISAWASMQSSPLISREYLLKRIAEYEEEFPSSVPLPPHWGGFSLRIDQMEFWQGQKDRLHDRIRYTRLRNRWKIERLYP
jgi:pyridoxamine 5'-phosphate oxidase